MASIAKDPNGRKRLQFTDPDGKRRAIRLGKISQREAEAIKTRVEHLIASKVSGCGWDGPTAQWVAGLSDTLADKLARAGLIQARERAVLGAFLDTYIKGRTDVAPRTVQWYRQAQRNMVEFFGADKPLRDITEGDAEDWRLHLIGKGYAEATVTRRVKYAKQFFTAAVRRRLIPESPFAVLKGGSQENRTRFYFVTREEAEKVLEHCPNAEWRLIFALSRYGARRNTWPYVGATSTGNATECECRAPKRHTTSAASPGWCQSSPSCGRTWKNVLSKPNRGPYTS